MTPTLVKLWAQHLRMKLREDLAPDQDELWDQPGVQPLRIVDDPVCRQLYGLAHQAHDRYRAEALELQVVAALQKGSEVDEEHLPPQLRPAAALVNSLMILFERQVRLRYGLPDGCNIVVTNEWRLYSYAARPKGCGGDCSDCDSDDCGEKDDDCQDCGDDCKKHGGPGCGRPDCKCEEPQDLKTVNITVSVDEAPSLKRVGNVFMQLSVVLAKRETEDGVHRMPIRISESGYRSMKAMCRLLGDICRDCEESDGFCTEDEEQPPTAGD